AVKMHQIHALTVERLFDMAAVLLVNHPAYIFGDGPGGESGFNQLSATAGPTARDHDRAMTGVKQRLVKLREDLLGAPDGVAADGCEGVRNADHGERMKIESRKAKVEMRVFRLSTFDFRLFASHSGSSRPSSASADAASSRKRRPVIPQGNC